MLASKLYTKKKKQQFLTNPFFAFVILRILMTKEIWESPAAISLFLLGAFYKLFKSYPPPLKLPIIPPRTIEIDEIKECILEEERMIILVANRRMHEIFWNDFSSYRIYGRTLFLVKTDRSGVIKLDETITGTKFFQPIFLEVIDRFDRLQMRNI